MISKFTFRIHRAFTTKFDRITTHIIKASQTRLTEHLLIITVSILRRRILHTRVLNALTPTLAHPRLHAILIHPRERRAHPVELEHLPDPALLVHVRHVAEEPELDAPAAVPPAARLAGRPGRPPADAKLVDLVVLAVVPLAAPVVAAGLALPGVPPADAEALGDGGVAVEVGAARVPLEHARLPLGEAGHAAGAVAVQAGVAALAGADVAADVEAALPVDAARAAHAYSALGAEFALLGADNGSALPCRLGIVEPCQLLPAAHP